MIKPKEIEEVKLAKEMLVKNLILSKIQGINGVGIGFDEKSKNPIIRVYIDESYNFKEVKKHIPNSVSGYKVDCQIIGTIRAL